MSTVLNAAEVRVLGSLVEKEITTPEYYPLSLHALINACNQKSNRDPLMNLDENEVREALRALNDQALARSSNSSESRVSKYEHRLQEVFNFNRHEMAILCVLLLRGPQTSGELRGRAERMHRFDDLSEVQSTLQHLMKREPPVVKILPRQPGTKEARYAHLLSGNPEPFQQQSSPKAAATHNLEDHERIARLENDLRGLQEEVSDLKQQLLDFRKQFQ
ncbi:MAG TPA: YceH family protein [Candidatus Dormibacteraeota bacterium]|nr:YceH family protein [Candidatus Dormibacteraeota bacterium]